MSIEEFGSDSPHSNRVDRMEVSELRRAEDLAQLSRAVRLENLALEPLLRCPFFSLEVSPEDTRQPMFRCSLNVQCSTPL